MDSCTVKFMMMVNWALPETSCPILIEKITSTMHQWLSGFRSLISGLQVYLHFNLQLSFGRLVRSQQFWPLFHVFRQKNHKSLWEKNNYWSKWVSWVALTCLFASLLNPFDFQSKTKKAQSLRTHKSIRNIFPSESFQHLSRALIGFYCKGSCCF